MGDREIFMENNNSKEIVKNNEDIEGTIAANELKSDEETKASAKKPAKEKASTLHWVPLIIALLYAVSPINLILKEAQIFGFIEVDWFEDVLFLLVGALHGIQKNVFIGKPKQQKILGLTKWILLGVGIVIIVVMIRIRTQ